MSSLFIILIVFSIAFFFAFILDKFIDFAFNKLYPIFGKDKYDKQIRTIICNKNITIDEMSEQVEYVMEEIKKYKLKKTRINKLNKLKMINL